MANEYMCFGQGVFGDMMEMWKKRREGMSEKEGVYIWARSIPFGSSAWPRDKPGRLHRPCLALQHTIVPVLWYRKSHIKHTTKSYSTILPPTGRCTTP